MRHSATIALFWMSLVNWILSSPSGHNIREAEQRSIIELKCYIWDGDWVVQSIQAGSMKRRARPQVTHSRFLHAWPSTRSCVLCSQLSGKSSSQGRVVCWCAAMSWPRGRPFTGRRKDHLLALTGWPEAWKDRIRLRRHGWEDQSQRGVREMPQCPQRASPSSKHHPSQITESRDLWDGSLCGSSGLGSYISPGHSRPQVWVSIPGWDAQNRLWAEDLYSKFLETLLPGQVTNRVGGTGPGEWTSQLHPDLWGRSGVSAPWAGLSNSCVRTSHYHAKAAQRTKMPNKTALVAQGDASEESCRCRLLEAKASRRGSQKHSAPASFPGTTTPRLGLGVP